MRMPSRTKAYFSAIEQKYIEQERIKSLRTGIWLYFFLLITEGALRKWFLTPLATPLLVVRTPLAMWLLYRALQVGALKLNGYILSMLATGSLSFIATMVWGHHNVFVAAYGLRILWIHFPLMFVMGVIFNKKDVLKLGEILCFMAIPMVLIILIQFFSARTAWINQGSGGTGTAAFSGALGYYRPSGTFSFTTGNTLFWSLLTPYVIYFWLSPGKIARLLLWGATTALLLSIPFSISRRLFYQVGVTLIFAVMVIVRRPKFAGRFAVAAAAAIILVMLLSDISTIRKGLHVFTTRFMQASASEGGAIQGTLVDRFLGGLFGSVIHTNDIPFWGYGLGKGTQVGTKLLTGSRGFLISEGEWGRLIGEMGLLLGLTVIFTRVALMVQMGWAALKKLRFADVLPWLLLSFGSIIIVTTQWGQPTSLGFSTLIGGLILASLNDNTKGKKITNR